MSVVVRRPKIGFELPVVVPTEILEQRDGPDWTPVIVVEERPGFVVKDRRKVK